MRRLQSFAFLAMTSFVALELSLSPARATEVLLNGGLEIGAGPQSWTLSQLTAASSPLGDYNNNGVTDAADYVVWRKKNGPASDYTQWRANFGNTGTPGLPVSAVELNDLGQEPPATGLGLFIKPFAGNEAPFADQNKAINVILSQTYVGGPSTAGKTFTFSGDSTWQSAYSGNVDTLQAGSPSGAIASPTKTQFQISFLTSSDSVLSTTTFDLPRNRVDTDPVTWITSSVAATAPATSFKVKVSLLATNMVANSCATGCTGGQDVKFDNFSLTDGVQTTTNRLANGNLDLVGAPANWTLTTVGNDAVQFSNGDFAVHSGNVGMWLRAFQGQNTNNPPNNPGPIDATISQKVVGATAGGQYTLSAYAKLQPGYSGLDPNSPTQTFLKMEFLDNTDTPIGAPVSLELGVHGLGADQNFWPANGPLGNGQGDWRQVSLPATVAPSGTVSIRVTGGATGMIHEPAAEAAGLRSSAMFDDFSLILGSGASGNLLTGDLAASVPEPASCWILVASGIGAAIRRRRVQKNL